MKTIWKFPLVITDRQTVPIPENGVPIHVGLDPHGNPCIWCEIPSINIDRGLLEVFIVGTGNEMPDRAENHLGSFIQGPFVWHVYTAP